MRRRLIGRGSEPVKVDEGTASALGATHRETVTGAECRWNWGGRPTSGRLRVRSLGEKQRGGRVKSPMRKLHEGTGKEREYMIGGQGGRL